MLIPGKKFFTIKEASGLTKVKPYILRYWEKEFNILRPVRRESGQRRYTAAHLHLIEKIKDLRFNRKFTIAGTKRELQKRKKEGVQGLLPMEQNPAAVEMLKKAKKELKIIFDMLSK